MNFTREPIIETIISPKEGYKLLVRNSRGTGSTEEFYVDAVEVVSFGRGFFFRSLERPKAFLVPVSDYEILEVKETRVALKNVSHERNIKIGGGRDASMRHAHREPPQEKDVEPLSAEEEQAPAAEATPLETAIGSRMEKRRDRRRHRRRRSDDQDWSERRQQSETQAHSETESKGEEGGKRTEDETKVSSSMFFIPPPPGLISDTLSRYKDKEFMEGAPRSKEVEGKKEKPPEEEKPGPESSLHRVAPVTSVESLEVTSFSSTFFSPLQGGTDYFF